MGDLFVLERALHSMPQLVQVSLGLGVEELLG